MTEDDPIYIEYSPWWERSHIWWRGFFHRYDGEIPKTSDGHIVPDSIRYGKRHLKYRDTDESGESVIVPAQCGCPNSSD